MESNTCISPLAKRPILYTDTLAGVQTCRDDLWAVTTEELNAAARAAPGVPAASNEDLNVVAHLANRAIWLAFVWNDHNFKAAHIEAREACARVGITTMEQAAKWVESGIETVLGRLPAPAGISQQAGGAVPVDRDGEIERLQTAKSHLIQQASNWRQEARCQHHTVISILQALGLPEEDYNALPHVLAHVEALKTSALAVPVQADRGDEPSFMRPTKWTLLMTGDNHGLVAEFGCKFEHSPSHYERVDVVSVGSLAATPVAPPASPSEDTGTVGLARALEIAVDVIESLEGAGMDAEQHGAYRVREAIANEIRDAALPGSTPDAAQGGA